MSRGKGTANLAASLEVLAGAPLDSRTVVPTVADLTVASNFPYKYVGMPVVVQATGDMYILTGPDVTDPNNWKLTGSGGGETYSDFTGATESAAGAHGLVPAPSAGDEGKVLFGNGAWGALPSVDLSVLSNEAFQFSTDEKPVGMWTDRKILYAKTVDCGTMPNNTTKSVAHGISNIEKVVGMFGFGKVSNGGYFALPTVNVTNLSAQIDMTSDATYIYFNTKADRTNFQNVNTTLFYTKTTDSPLPAGVKFAGVTASGEVILEKTLTDISVIVPSDSWVNNAISGSGMSKLVDVTLYRDDFTNIYFPAEVALYQGYINICGNHTGRTITSAKIRYVPS